MTAFETTIKKLEEQTFQGKPNGFKVTLADNTEGYLQKESDDGLREGDKVIAEVKDYTSKAGKHSNLITLRKPQYASHTAETASQAPPPQRPTINVGAGKSKQEMQAQASIDIACVLLKAFGEGKLESAQVYTSVAEFGRLLWSEIDEIYSKK